MLHKRLQEKASTFLNMITKVPYCKNCKTNDHIIENAGYYYCTKCTGDEVYFKNIEVKEKKPIWERPWRRETV